MENHPVLILNVVLLLACSPAMPAAGERPEHWAYVAPVPPETPSFRSWGPGVDAAESPIDAFVRARLAAAGPAPSPPAERSRLLRRVSLDLTGLPPPVGEVRAFVADSRPDSFERVVDRLLASPHFGERWARHWLDLAHYADSNGFQRDGHRESWPYRDWVIRALNADMPFDRFTIEQVAGDLLPDATLDQKIATGFFRSTTVNVEAGVDQEENRVHQVADRVNTAATVWLGTTLECAQCHDHKYDPFTQTEYYQLFAFLNNTPIETRFKTKKDTAAIDFDGPTLRLPLTDEQIAERNRLARRVDELKKKAAQAAQTAQTAQTARAAGDALQAPQAKQRRKQLAALEKKLKSISRAETLVMEELAAPRVTRVMKRGDYRDTGAAVNAGVPRVLHELPAAARSGAGDAGERRSPGRLALARWLVARENPLVHRVTVNRWWAELFGRGIVATREDFGTRGDRPTHPLLLDWLATEFAASGGSMKETLRRMVTSSTYRQSSRMTPQHRAVDPHNRWYARGARFRLDAETIRDNALAISGRLSRRMGGPPILPPQPAGIWRVTGVVDNKYRTSAGEARYRRSVYVVWRRSSPYPSFVVFDAPDRSACCTKRPRTNTPLQALALMNDPVYVDFAMGLAERMIAERAGAGVEERIAHGFRLCVARPPNAPELAELVEYYEAEHSRLAASPHAVDAILRGSLQASPAGPGQGGALTPPVEDRSRVELAALVSVATLLLNLDETITRG